MRILGAIAAASLAMAAACAPGYTGGARAVEPASIGGDGWIRAGELPARTQRGDEDCGAAAAAGVLAYWNVYTTVDRVERATGRDGGAGIAAGTLRDHIRAHGLRAFVIRGSLRDLAHEVSAGRPVIVGTLKPYGRKRLSHYQVVIAVREDLGGVVTHDPSDGWRLYDRDDFQAEWDGAGNLALVVLPPAAERP